MLVHLLQLQCDYPWSRFVLLFLFLSTISHLKAENKVTPLKLYSATLPGGVGKVLLYKYCVTCHGVDLVRKRLEQLRGMKLEEWENLVYAMIDSWGAPIERQETGPLSRYLFDNYGPDTVSSSNTTLEEYVPAGPQHIIILQKCLACHDATVTRRRLQARVGSPASVWRQIVARMRTYGVALTDEEVAQVSQYLGSVSKTASSQNEKMANEFYAFLPAGNGKDLITATCLSCHGAIELKQRMESHPAGDQHYWERVVGRMRNQWQAPLEENEAGVAVEYLNTHFSK